MREALHPLLSVHAPRALSTQHLPGRRAVIHCPAIRPPLPTSPE
jgi:hypothetical protein